LFTVRSAFHKAGARLLAAALALPMLAGGAVPAAAATHSMTPAVNGLAQYYALPDATAPTFPCILPTPRFPPGTICYGPDQIKAAYDLQPLHEAGIKGAGQTIVIVDAFSSPMLTSDVANFNAAFNLPATDLTIVPPEGGITPFDGSRLQMGWALEISLDVEWAHFVAPDAKLVLVLAKTEQDADMLHATEYAIDHGLGDVITQSFGESESCADPALLREEHAAFERAAARGITLIAGSGDFGATNLLCDGSGIATVAKASTPASDPDVTAVGGTRLNADPLSGAYIGETGWGDALGASGGGFSSIYRRPGYQAPFVSGNGARGVPDVAYSADPTVVAFFAFRTGFGVLGGTSVGTPQWAGIAALSEQMAGHRLPQLNIRLYHIAKSAAYQDAFHDITTGNNSAAGVTGFDAGPGWDPVTGLGTPDVAKLVPLLSHAA
jgi:subtilase family serine protease